MPYQHSKHAPLLRRALVRLKEEKVASAQSLVDALIKAKRMPTGGQDISRPALAEFINGRDSIKIMALAALWDFLNEHPVYRGYVPVEHKVGDDINALILGAVFARTCRAPQDYPWPPAKDDARFGLAGSFVMFCPPWKPIPGRNVLHVMKFATQMVHGSFIADIFHKQPDGSLVTYNCVLQEWEVMGTKAVCFAGRQANNTPCKPGIACMAVATTLPPPADGEILLSWFNGALCATEQPDRFPFVPFFPAVAFFCRRYQPQGSDGAALDSGELTAIPDDDPDRKRLLDLF
jgi:hypothetical protein